MANGSFEFEADGYLQGKIIWSSTSNGSNANTSTVTATIYARRTNNYTTSGRNWSGWVHVDGSGTDISFSSSVSVGPSWVEMAKTTKTVTHNSDGTKTIGIDGSVTGPSGTALAGNTSSGEAEVTLDTIPRYLSGWGEVVTPLLNTATVSWQTSENCSAIKYGFNASSLTERTVSGKSGSFTLTGLTPETNYTFYINFKRADSGLYNPSNDSTTFKTKAIAKLTSVPNINIGDSHTITWSAPTGTNATFSLVLLKSDGSAAINFGTVTGTSKTVTPTASTLYSWTPNSNTATANYILTTTANGTSYQNSKSFTFKVTNSNPTFTNYTYADTNSTTVALTGSNQILVNGYSNVTATISTTNKATAKNYATMKSYTMSIGSQSTNPVTYSSSSQVQLSLSKVKSGTIIVSATDSRTNSTAVTKTATFKNYSDLVIKSVTATRANNGVGKIVTLTYSGTYWNGSFGSVTNSIKTLNYKYKLTTATSWTSGTTTLTKTTSGTNWSGSIEIKGDLGAEGFDISNAYDIRLTAGDELVTKTYDVTISSGTPAITIYKNKVAIGKQYDTSMGRTFQVGGNSYFDNNIAITRASGGTSLNIGVTRTDTGGNLWFGIAANGTDEGIYSNDLSKWIVRANSSGVNFYGEVENSSLTTITNTNPDGEWTCYPTFVSNTSGNLAHRVNNGLIYYTKEGTADAVGVARLRIGNGVASGTAGNKRGRLRIFGEGGYFSELMANVADSNKYVYLPDASGTIQLHGTSLYNNTTGTTGTVTLSSSAANYLYLKIYYRTNDNWYGYVDVYNPNNKTVYLSSGYNDGASKITYLKSKAIKISGTSIGYVASTGLETTIDNLAITSHVSANNIYIVRVEGYI